MYLLSQLKKCFGIKVKYKYVSYSPSILYEGMTQGAYFLLKGTAGVVSFNLCQSTQKDFHIGKKSKQKPPGAFMQ